MSAVAEVTTTYEQDALRRIAEVGGHWYDIRTHPRRNMAYPEEQIREGWHYLGAVEAQMYVGGGFHKLEVLTGPLDGELAYWAAMHEIGHVNMGHMADPYVNSPYAMLFFGEKVMQAEVDAWNWAFDNAPFTPSLEARRTAWRALNSYSEGLQQPIPDNIHAHLRLEV